MSGEADSKMRVAMLAPISWRTPPRHYGPWELVVSLLTEGLVERGIDVTLFATADSVTRANLAAVCPRPYSEDPSLDPKVWECLHISAVFERADEFDLIHNHFDFLPLTYAGLVATPVVTTIHGFSSERILPVYRKYNGRSNIHYVSISHSDRSPDLRYIGNVYHGIDLSQFPDGEKKDDYLLFWGRIHPDKGAAEAIEFARAAGKRLVMAGIVQDEDYFDREVRPHIDGEQVVYLGPVGPDRRPEVLGRATALLHLINFEEPFGLSVVESLACGTPVIASPRGSMPEILEAGVTGAFWTGKESPRELVEEVARLDATVMRNVVEKRFSRDRMAEDYLTIYRRILTQSA